MPIFALFWIIPVVVHGVPRLVAGVRYLWFISRRLTGRVHLHRGPRVLSFAGRAGRREWLVVVAGYASLLEMSGWGATSIDRVMLAIFAPFLIAITYRRLHDIGLSGLWSALPTFLVLVCVLVRGALSHFGLVGADFNLVPDLSDPPLDLGSELAIAVSGLLLAIGLIWLAMWGGKKGGNVYGEAD